MAELCTAFKRIVPRYQFSTNQAAFTIEDMKDAPLKKRNGGDCFRGKMCGQNKLNELIVCGKCDRRCDKQMGVGRYCSTMDTCSNWKSKVSYYHDM